MPVCGGADGVAGSVEYGGEHPYRPQTRTIIGGSCLALLQTKQLFLNQFERRWESVGSKMSSLNLFNGEDYQPKNTQSVSPTGFD